MTYRSRYASVFQLGAVLDLMICDESNPRSIAYQLVQSVAHVEQLGPGAQSDNGPADEGLTAELLQTIRCADIVRIARDYKAGRRGPLKKLLESIDTKLPELSDVIAHRYFYHSGPIQRLAEIDFELPPKMSSVQ